MKITKQQLKKIIKEELETGAQIDNLIAQFQSLSPNEQIEFLNQMFGTEEDNEGQIIVYTGYKQDEDGNYRSLL